jgi:hypothetical protein
MKLRSISRVLAMFAVAVLLFSASAAIAQQVDPPADDAAPALSGTASAPAGGGGPGPISEAFSYQGRLNFGGGPVNGTCDFQFSLWDQSGSGTPPTGGTQFGSTETQSAVPVSQGLFTVVLNAANGFGDNAFLAARWLQIAVRCPAGGGSYTTLSPRQPLSAAPYASGLRPGTRIRGSDYQVVKIQSDAVSGSIPAAVTGEMMSALDGVGVYGSSNSNAAGSEGAGVWGRTWNLAGAGVKGTAHNGSVGVLGEAVVNGGVGVRAVSNGTSLSSPALFAEATSTKAAEPAGIAIYAKNHGGDTTIVAHNTGSGDYFRAINAGNYIVYRVTSTGRVVTSAVEIYGGGDLAERFEARDGAEIEPGTLMVIDPAHPGKLKPSASAYDPKVAGIVSGAGGVDPGLTLHQNGVMEGNTVVALAGRVYVKAEAISAPILPGDLLTSSAIAGRAMKATDRALAQGAVIGKAMTGLEQGRGLVLVLVSLQ